VNSKKRRKESRAITASVDWDGEEMKKGTPGLPSIHKLLLHTPVHF